jgi:branched-chain amino acid transport system substrate-binding protein
MEKLNKKERKAVDRRTFLKVAGAAGAATLVGGFPYVVRAKPKEVLIGTIHPLSGGLAQAGNGLKTGVVLAAEEINRAGGIKSLGGAKLKLIHADSGGKPEIGVSEAERLIKEGVVATFGCYQSSVTFAVTQIHEKYKTPFLITLAISEKILQRGFKYTFRVRFRHLRAGDHRFDPEICQGDGHRGEDHRPISRGYPVRGYHEQ